MYTSMYWLVCSSGCGTSTFKKKKKRKVKSPVTQQCLDALWHFHLKASLAKKRIRTGYFPQFSHSQMFRTQGNSLLLRHPHYCVGNTSMLFG